jgi:hypothetical protein
MNLKEFLDERYSGDEVFEKWKKKFPLMYEYAEKVEVIPWSDEYAVADRNPEIIDALEYYDFLRENGLISDEEHNKYITELNKQMKGIASKTLGIAFMEENKVSFREKAPKLYVALHELGHCYFKKPDPLWASSYGGGEDIMWLITADKLSPQTEYNELAVANYMDWLQLTKVNPLLARNLIDAIARHILTNKGFDVNKELEQIADQWGVNVGEYPARDALDVINAYNGTMPQKDISMLPAEIINLVVAIHYGEHFPSLFIEGLISTNPKTLINSLNQDNNISPSI